jgi:hypothetical protein
MMDEMTAVQLTCSGDIPEHWRTQRISILGPPRVRS